MLSGLTSRVGTLIGSATNKTSTTTESSPTTTAPDVTSAHGSTTAQSSTAAAEGNTTVGGSSDDSSGTTGTTTTGGSGTASGVLGSVRSQLPSWLGGGGSKGGAVDDPTQTEEKPTKEQLKPKKRPPGKSANTQSGTRKSTKEPKEGGDDESDASSATGGADDDQQLSDGEGGSGTPTAGLEKVKNLGNLLYSTILGAGQKIKETTILGDFQREHDTFLRSKFGGRSSVSVPPWIGHPQEDELKLEILSLSNDRRNFVRCPPVGVSFSWDWDSMAPVANALLKEDPNLQTMRYTLVPKVISEDDFWRNYFYRVSLLKESMTSSGECVLPGESSSLPTNSISQQKDKKRVIDDAELERELNEELQSFEVIPSTAGTGSGKKDLAEDIEALLDLK